MREGVIDGFRATLSVDDIVGGGELVQEVEAFEAEDELTAHEGLAEGGIEHEVIGIEQGAAVTSTAIHGGIGGESHTSYFLSP